MSLLFLIRSGVVGLVLDMSSSLYGTIGILILHFSHKNGPACRTCLVEVAEVAGLEHASVSYAPVGGAV